MKYVCVKCVLSMEDPSPPPLSTKVDTDVIHMIKWTTASDKKKLDGGKAWERG